MTALDAYDEALERYFAHPTLCRLLAVLRTWAAL